MCFGIWGTLAIPFSLWHGGSFHLMLSYWRTDLMLMFIIAALVRTWRNCRVMMFTMAAAAAVSLLTARYFGKMSQLGRLSLDFGTVSNANDFAAHLLLVLPFLLWVVLSSKHPALRFFALCGVAYGLFVVLATGSRGALVALACDVLFFMFATRSRYRIAFALVMPFILAAAIVFLPGVVRNRLESFSSSDANASRDAIASTQARERLLRDSIVCALQNPLFGVGPGQFPTYEGKTRPSSHWQAAHNSYVTAASECGIPGLLFFLAAVWYTWHLLGAVGQRTRRKRQLLEMTNAIFCIRLGMVGFCVAIFFLNFTYLFYLPAMAALSTAFVSAARKELSKWSTDTHEASPLHFAWTGPASA
jgi:O-antigen ligase